MKVALYMPLRQEKGALQSGDETLRREIELPFVPFPGLVLGEKAAWDWQDGYQIETVIYDLETGAFECWLKVFQYLGRGNLAAIKEQVDFFVEAGWEVRE